MSKLLYFKVYNKDVYFVQNKIIKYNISVIKSYKNNLYIYYLVTHEDYDYLCKFDYKNVMIFDRNYGFFYLLDFFRKNIEKIIISFSIILLLFLSKFFIYKVNVKTNDNEMKKIIIYFLEDEGVRNFSTTKSFRKLNRIKDKLLKKYNDKIEWLEITKRGYEYNVDIIKRKKNKEKSNFNRCNYVALKSGTINSIIIKRGVPLVQENNFVNAGDVLISGDVIYNDELKTEVCADGIITGEVWYKVNVSYPLKKSSTYKKNDGKYNFKFNIFTKEYYLFKNNNDNKNKLKIGFDFFNISLVKSSNTYKKTITYTEKEAINNALKLSSKKFLKKVSHNSKILSQNILKKEVKNDKIYLEVLVTVEEELGVVENY